MNPQFGRRDPAGGRLSFTGLLHLTSQSFFGCIFTSGIRFQSCSILDGEKLQFGESEME